MNKISEGIELQAFFDNLNFSHRDEDKLKAAYKALIENFEKLNNIYNFSCSFNESYVYDQLESLFQKEKKSLSFIPFGIKDIFNTKVLPTEMGSDIWKDFRSGNNARIVDEIQRAGGISFCKTTTAEFAVHYFEDNRTLNPHNKDHITGTSSAGSAVAVACGALPVALATQTAGSIIRPASFCGVFGFKPSFGALDRTGVLKTNDTLDTIGFMGKDIDILVKSFFSLYQNTEDYPLSKQYLLNYKNKNKEIPNILILGDQFNQFSNYDSYVKGDFEDITNFMTTRFKVINVPEEELNFLNDIHQSHQAIYDKSLSYYFIEESKVHEKISPVMSQIIQRGEQISREDYIGELSRQIEYTNLFNKLLEKYDIDFIVTPSTASYAPKVGKQEKEDTSLIWTYLGLPAISLPLFFNDQMNLPYGLQICSFRYNDFSLLEFASQVYENCRK